MLEKIYPLLAYLKYFLRQEDRHSLQSPFSFKVYEGLKKNLKTNDDTELKALRKQLLQNHKKITIQDFGAGSIHLKEPIRRISDITRHSTSSSKFSKLYQYFCSLTPAQTVIELGTCVGINTCYLARATKGKLYTFEGAEELAKVARNTFSNFSKVSLLIGQIEITLPEFLKRPNKLDFVLIDAHHAYQPTLTFWEHITPFLNEDSIVAIGDIHRSKEMEQAWHTIKDSPSVTMSMDFYECGILFFKKGLNKKHYILHY
ncbi:class I SAM-dependent methyltransferase [Echinicola sp. CAU 1574]|uniref:Class I SAM-dependent methyltransferase n=1 Tax=Echinicola arenosa TaxID=2774144 RepID=A0ABR9AGD6_9BACT|nr:class I SAM-dependent methyltransferase [Echinicola arenosa]MBD8487554.1 class I SAM-dependent methyltransferase [Echinicola arenosa]